MVTENNQADPFGPCTIQGLQQRCTHMLPRVRDKLAIPPKAIKALDGTNQEHIVLMTWKSRDGAVMTGSNGGGNRQTSELSGMSSQELMQAHLEAEARYLTTTGAEQQRWFDRRVEIAAEFTARFGSWPEPKRSAEDPAARSYRIPSADEIKAFGETELERTYLESIEAAETTDHIGRKNRFAGVRSAIVQELKARGIERPFFRRLTEHSDPQVRAAASAHLTWLDRPASESVPIRTPSLRTEMLWQCDHPPPLAMTRDEIAARLRHSVPVACDRLMEMALPAIRLWPQRRADIPATTTRFGGTPLAPRSWQWPTYEAEPLLFIGQVNCAELFGLPGAELLPPSGLLAFFGDHDGVTGCFPFADGGIYHWADVDRLAPTQALIEPSEVFLSCALVPHAILDLPHPFSRAVRELALASNEEKSYHEAWLDICNHGIPDACVGYAGFSKLLGWPDLVQSDLWRFDTSDDARLLLQVDLYCNGEDTQGWGPGGSLYYVLSEQDLRAHNYESCEFEGQFT